MARNITEKQKANLKPPINKRSTKEQREIRRKGGKKSAEVRRLKKSFKEAILSVLHETLNPDTADKVISNRQIKSMLQKGDTPLDIMTKALLKNAMNGDSKSFELLRDTIGEKPTERIEVNEVDTQRAKEIEEYLENNKNA